MRIIAIEINVDRLLLTTDDDCTIFTYVLYVDVRVKIDDNNLFDLGSSSSV
jgi:hypothetical protein